MSKQSHTPSHSETSTTHSQSAHSPTLAELAIRAIAQIDDAEKGLPVRSDMLATEQKVARGYNPVPTSALILAAQIAEANPELVPGFDVGAVKDAVDYETAMKKVANRLRQVSRRIDRSILKTRMAPAQGALALYAALKGVARLPGNDHLHDPLQEMAQMIREPRQRGKRKAAAAVARHEQKRLADAGVNAPPPAAPAAEPTHTEPQPAAK